MKAGPLIASRLCVLPDGSKSAVPPNVPTTTTSAAKSVATPVIFRFPTLAKREKNSGVADSSSRCSSGSNAKADAARNNDEREVRGKISSFQTGGEKKKAGMARRYKLQPNQPTA